MVIPDINKWVLLVKSPKVIIQSIMGITNPVVFKRNDFIYRLIVPVNKPSRISTSFIFIDVIT